MRRRILAVLPFLLLGLALSAQTIRLTQSGAPFALSIDDIVVVRARVGGGSVVTYGADQRRVGVDESMATIQAAGCTQLVSLNVYETVSGLDALINLLVNVRQVAEIRPNVASRAIITLRTSPRLTLRSVNSYNAIASQFSACLTGGGGGGSADSTIFATIWKVNQLISDSINITNLPTAYGVYTSGPVTGSGTTFFPVTLLNNSINDTYIAQGTVDSTEVTDLGLSSFDIAQMGATPGQVLVWNGGHWVPDSVTGGGGISTNLYIADGTLLTDRTVTGGGNDLFFVGLAAFGVYNSGVMEFDSGNDIFFNADDRIDLLAGGAQGIYMEASGGNVGIQSLGGDARTFSLGASNYLITDYHTTTNLGLKYFAYYPDILTNARSIPDVGMVKGLISDSLATFVGAIGGSGTLNFVPKFTPDGATLGDSRIFDDGTTLGLGTSSVSTDGRVNVMGSTTPATAAILFRNSGSPTHGTFIRHRGSDLDHDADPTTGWVPTDFYMWGSSYKNVQAIDYPSVPNDNFVYGMGVNWGPQGSVDPTKPAFGINFEQNYWVPGFGQCIEWNIGMNKAGGGTWRALYVIHSHTGSASLWQESSNAFTWLNEPATQTMMSLNDNLTIGGGVVGFRAGTISAGTLPVFSAIRQDGGSYMPLIKLQTDNDVEWGDISGSSVNYFGRPIIVNGPAGSAYVAYGNGNMQTSGDINTGQLTHWAGAGGFFHVFYANGGEHFRLQGGLSTITGNAYVTGRQGIGATPDATQLLYAKKTTSGGGGIMMENTHASGIAGMTVKNSAGTTGSFTSYGPSATGVPALDGKVAFGATTAIVIYGDGSVASGGTSAISFQPGGYAGAAEVMRLQGTGMVVGSTDATLATFRVVGSVRFDVGSDATGDMYYRNSSGLLTRIPLGSNTHVLTLTGGVPGWAAASGGGGGSPGGSVANIQWKRNTSQFGGAATINYDTTNTRFLFSSVLNNHFPGGWATVSGDKRVFMSSDPGVADARSQSFQMGRWVYFPHGTGNGSVANEVFAQGFNVFQSDAAVHAFYSVMEGNYDAGGGSIGGGAGDGWRERYDEFRYAGGANSFRPWFYEIKPGASWAGLTCPWQFFVSTINFSTPQGTAFGGIAPGSISNSDGTDSWQMLINGGNTLTWSQTGLSELNFNSWPILLAPSETRINTNGTLKFLGTGTIQMNTTANALNIYTEAGLHVYASSATQAGLSIDYTTSGNTKYQVGVNFGTGDAYHYVAPGYYQSFHSNNAERFRILTTGQMRFLNYGSGTFTGTAIRALSVAADGSVIESTLPVSSKWTDVGSGNIYRNSLVHIGGTSDPAAKLQVTGTAAGTVFSLINSDAINLVNVTNSAAITFGPASTVSGQSMTFRYLPASQGQINFSAMSGTTEAPAFAFKSNDAVARARMWASGNIYFLQVSTNGGSLASAFQVIAWDANGGRVINGDTYVGHANYFTRPRTTAIVPYVARAFSSGTTYPMFAVENESASTTAAIFKNGSMQLGVSYDGPGTGYSGAPTRMLEVTGTSYLNGNVGIKTGTAGVSLDISGATDAMRLPNGTTAQRPTAAAGQWRYNTTVGGFEGRDGSKWVRLTSTTTPSISAGAAAGTGPTVSVSGNDMAGSISVTTGTSTTTGTLCTITFNQAFDGAAQITVMLDGGNDIATTHRLQYRSGSAGNTSFTVTVPSTPLTDATAYVINYTIHQ